MIYRFFDESVDACDEGPTDFNLAIANSVIWACALDEALTEKLGQPYSTSRDEDKAGRTLFGLRLARNAILHGQTFGIQPEGMGYPIDYPLFYGPPLWKSYEELTRDWTPRNKGPGLARMRTAYEEEVARAAMPSPLLRAREWLGRVRENGWQISPSANLAP